MNVDEIEQMFTTIEAAAAGAEVKAKEATTELMALGDLSQQSPETLSHLRSVFIDHLEMSAKCCAMCVEAVKATRDLCYLFKDQQTRLDESDDGESWKNGINRDDDE